MMTFSRCIILIAIVGLLPSLFSYAQSSKIDSLLEAVNTERDYDNKAKLYLQLSELVRPSDLEKSLDYLQRGSQLAENDSLLGSIWDQKGRLYYAGNDLENALQSFRTAKELIMEADNPTEAARINNRIGVVLLRQKKHQEALEVFLESASFFEEKEDHLNLAVCYNNMAGVFADMADYSNAVRYNEEALQIFQEQNIQQYEIITLTSLSGQYLKMGDVERAKSYSFEAEKLGEKLNDPYALGIIYNNLGQLFFEEDNLEKAVEFYKKSLEIKQSSSTGANLVPAYNNMGQIYIRMNRPEEAINYLTQGLKLARGDDEFWQLYSNLTKAYMAFGNKDSAVHFFELTLAHRDSALSVERQKAIADLRTRYETEKKEREILELEAKQQQTYFFVYGLGGLSASILLISLLLLKNYRRKKIIAEKNEKIEKQQIQQLLKEQELIRTEAMLKGQKQERKKIAEDLHDSIGSSLSTLKLYIDGLAPENSDVRSKKVHNRAEELFEHTYDQIRRIAHHLNAESMDENDLISAIQTIADDITESRKMHIRVMNTDLPDNIPAPVKFCILNSVQELLSNVVKHSGATEAVLQITKHDTTINVLMEDNGKGFDLNKENDGLGLNAIRNRTESLGGELTIDSSKNRGTTVILDIPLK